MAPIINRRVILNEYPTDLPVPSQTTTLDTSQTIDLDNVPLNGGILLKTLVLALEPALLVLMRPSVPEIFRYQIGEPVKGHGIVVVVRSESPAFQLGDHLCSGFLPFQEYVVQQGTELFTKVRNEYGLPWSVFIGVAGVSGITAYAGWREYSRAKKVKLFREFPTVKKILMQRLMKGEVAFVSSGAGAVGSLVIQLAKQDGVKVIASAGSDDKVRYMEELGADVAFNYKTTKTSDVLAKEGPIDVYWDNVGGETLEAALGAAATHARFIECGAISGYHGIPKLELNLFDVMIKAISINVFVVSALYAKYLETFERQVPALLASGDLKYREDITRGLENAGTAIAKFFKGEIIGKGVVVVADE